MIINKKVIKILSCLEENPKTNFNKLCRKTNIYPANLKIYTEYLTEKKYITMEKIGNNQYDTYSIELTEKGLKTLKTIREVE